MNVLHSLNQLSPQRILIVKPSALGDVVQSLPLLPALKARFPQAEMTWVIQQGLEELIAGHPDVHDLILFRRKGTWNDWRRLLQELWSRRFDLVIDLQGLLRTGVMTAATRARVRLGLETAREGSDWTLTHILSQTGREVPAGERYLRVLDALGADRFRAQLQIAWSDQDAQWTAQQLEELPRPVIAVHPGARWVTKRWPVENFSDVLLKAVHTWNSGIVILGSPAEREDAEKLTALLANQRVSKSVRNLTGQTTLKQLASLLQRVDAVISNDSGPMHLAAGLGTPTLGLFTCTDAKRSGPTGTRHETVSTTISCGGSYRKNCPHSGAIHLACFRELETARVWSALIRLLEKNGVVKSSTAAA